MQQRIGQLGCFLLLLIAAGCKGMFGSQGLPPDPLFANHKAVESKTTAGPPADIRFAEPTPPGRTFAATPR